jgi:hypothetical protein
MDGEGPFHKTLIYHIRPLSTNDKNFLLTPIIFQESFRAKGQFLSGWRFP